MAVCLDDSAVACVPVLNPAIVSVMMSGTDESLRPDSSLHQELMMVRVWRGQGMVAQLIARLGDARARNLALLVAAASFLVAGCNSVGSSTLTFWDIVWSMLVFYFIFMLIWIFIAIFADILRRHDLPGIQKAIWIIVLFIIPFLGALIYIIMRSSSAGDSMGSGTTPPPART